MAFVEDVTEFFDETHGFAVSCVVGGSTVSGIFDNDFLTSLGVTAGTGPVLLLPASDAASASQGSSITVAGTSYTITGIEPDGTGMVLLRLQEA